MKTPLLCFSHNNKIKLYFLSGSVALFTGAAIYLLFRPVPPVFLKRLDSMIPNNWLGPLRQQVAFLAPHLPEWIVFSLPGGLWAFAYALTITAIWSGSRSRLRYGWMISIPLLTLGFECSQYWHFIPGTFCLNDLVMSITGAVAGISLAAIPTKTYTYEKQYH
jgi:hypothetical protein